MGNEVINEADRDIALKVAFAFLGKPYVWGGNDPIAGFDCSGLVIECLKSVGRLPRAGDWSADSLYRKFQDAEVEQPYKGCLVLWEAAGESRMVHVEMCMDQFRSIGASGGGSKTLTVADAIVQDAYIKVRPWSTRGGIVHFVDPFND